MLAITKELIDNLEARGRRNKNGCLEWTCGKMTYPNISINNELFGVHRLVAAFYHGLDLNHPGSLACHHCDNRRCIEKTHIYPGTHHSNTMDAVRRGRYVVNGKTTHCPRGHKYTDKTTCYSRGHKRCRPCHREETKAYQVERRKFFKKVYGTTKPRRRDKNWN